MTSLVCTGVWRLTRTSFGAATSPTAQMPSASSRLSRLRRLRSCARGRALCTYDGRAARRRAGRAWGQGCAAARSAALRFREHAVAPDRTHGGGRARCRFTRRGAPADGAHRGGRRGRHDAVLRAVLVLLQHRAVPARARGGRRVSTIGPSERGITAHALCLLLVARHQLAAQARLAALRRLELGRLGVCARPRPRPSARTPPLPVGRGAGVRAGGAHAAARRIQRRLRSGGGLSGLRAGVLQLAAQGRETALRGNLETAGAQAAEAAATTKQELNALARAPPARATCAAADGRRQGARGRQRGRADRKAAELKASQGRAAGLRGDLVTSNKQCMLTHTVEQTEACCSDTASQAPRDSRT